MLALVGRDVVVVALEPSPPNAQAMGELMQLV